MSKAGLFGATSMLVLILCGTASAQTATNPAGPDSQAAAIDQSAPQDDDDIVVTAQKRVENVQSVPKSVQVIGAAQLATANVATINDLARISPSFQPATSADNTTPILRGISSFSTSIGVPTQVGIVIDDVPQPPFSHLFEQLSDVERVEILPGPQSTQSGRNAVAGLLNIVTKAPSRTFTGTASITQTTDSQTRGSFYISGPITDTAAISLSGFGNQYRGNVFNTKLNRWSGGDDAKGVRAKLLWEAAPALKVQLSGYLLKDDFDVPQYGQAPAQSVAPGAFVSYSGGRGTFAVVQPGITPGRYNREYYADGESFYRRRERGATLRLDYALPSGIELTSLSSYVHSNQKAGSSIILNFPNPPAVGFPFAGSRTDTDIDNLIQEFRITSPSTGAFTWLAGAIYNKSDTDLAYQRGLFAVDWDRSTRFRTIAGYARGTMEFTPQLLLTGGLRYQSDKVDFDWLFNVPPGGTGAPAFRNGKSDYSFLSGEISPQFRITPDVMVYGTYSRAETGQAYDLENNVSAVANILAPLPSEKAENVAVGLKSQFFDRRVTFNIDVFTTAYKNFQVQSTFIPTDPTQLPRIQLLSVGRVRSRGVEATLTAKPVPTLLLTMNAAYIDAKITDFPNAQCYKGQTAALGCQTTSIGNVQTNLAGSTMPNSPKFKLNGSANYTIVLPNAAFDVDLNTAFRWQSKAQFDVFGNPATIQESYGTVNFAVGLKDKQKRYSVDLFVNNVFDTNYSSYLTDESLFVGQVITAGYDRDSFRYGGIRLTAGF